MKILAGIILFFIIVKVWQYINLLDFRRDLKFGDQAYYCNTFKIKVKCTVLEVGQVLVKVEGETPSTSVKFIRYINKKSLYPRQ